MNLNKAMIIGNLTRDPEVKTTPSGLTVATFSVATNMIWTDQSGQKQEKVEFHNIVAWKRLAEICGQYLKKGSKVYVEGRLQTRDWTGQDGVKRYRTEIVVENMIMLDRAGGTNAAPMAPRSYNSASSNEPIIDSEVPVGQDDSNPMEEEIKVENIPF
jgi:single-strand DNA-binding protein